MPVSELQARVFFANLRGDITLPPVPDMKKDVEMETTQRQERYVNSPRHTIQVKIMLPLGFAFGHFEERHH